MNVQKTEQFLAMQLLSTYMKNTMGDSPMFDIVMESIMKNVEEGNDNGLLEAFTSQCSREGQPLDSNSLNVLRVNGVSIADLSTNNLGTTERINNAISNAAKKYGVDEKLIRAIIKQESNFNPYAVSGAGAMGLMQIMPMNFQSNGISDPFNIEQNIDGGVKQLKGYLNMYNGSVEMALMAYNGGPGTMKKRGVSSPQQLYKMPAETRNYVNKVISNMIDG